MNIVEAFIKFNKELIILISGLSGSGKTQIASFIERDFKIKKINIEEYCIENNDRIVTLPDGVTVKDWDHIDSYNWNKINEDIDKYKSNGVVVCGPYFLSEKMKIEESKYNPFHIHIKITKQQLIERRKEYIKNNPDKCEELQKFIDTPTETLMINKITMPHYYEYLEKSKIDKFINAKDININEIYDQTADFLFYKIQEFLDEYTKNIKKQSRSKSKEKNRIYLGTINDDGDVDYIENYDYDPDPAIKYDDSEVDSNISSSDNSSDLSTTSI